MNKNKLLLHICCGPCACYPFKEFERKGYKILGYWDNPNIHGYREYTKRHMALGYYAHKMNDMELVEHEYDPEKWFESISDFSKPKRCSDCYKIRIHRTAERAKQHKIKNFSTTLLYSKFQNHEEIKKICSSEAKKNELNFVYQDLRKGWKEGIKESKRMGIYRQQYCGCIFSERERYDVS
ncbi:MAG: epoxyqueuosine reductase QueH [Elusimicrobiota bacterium]